MATGKILLIGDAPDNYPRLSELLRDLPAELYSLTWLDSDTEGARAVKASEYDVCLLAYHRLNTHTGLDFLREVCALECDTPIIVLADNDDSQMDLAAMKAGANDFLLTDGLSPALLARALRYATQRAQRLRLARETAARRATEAAHRAQDELLKRLAHELRTPLNAILGWAKLLRSGRLDEAAFARGLAAIETSARTQAQLIEDLRNTGN